MNIGLPKRKVVSQPPFFQRRAVSLKECKHNSDLSLWPLYKPEKSIVVEKNLFYRQQTEIKGSGKTNFNKTIDVFVGNHGGPVDLVFTSNKLLILLTLLDPAFWPNVFQHHLYTKKGVLSFRHIQLTSHVPASKFLMYYERGEGGYQGCLIINKS